MIIYRSTIDILKDHRSYITHKANNSNKEQYTKEHSHRFQRYSRREWNLWNLWECSLVYCSCSNYLLYELSGYTPTQRNLRSTHEALRTCN